MSNLIEDIRKKLNEFRKQTHEKARPVREAVKFIGQSLKGMYYDIPKAIIEEVITNEQSQKHEGQDAVQQTDQNSGREEELEGKSVRGREGEDSQVRGPEDAGPLRRAREKKKFQSPPQVRQPRK